MKKYPFVKQEGKKDCGVSALSMIIQYYGGFVPLERLRELSNTDQSGVSAYHLMECAKEIGFHADGFHCTIGNLKEIQTPVIAHVLLEQKQGHYIVIYEVNQKKKFLLVADPQDRIKKMEFDDFEEIWDGVIITLSPYQPLPITNLSFSVWTLFQQFLKEYRIELLELFLFSIFLTIFSIFQSFFFELFTKELQITSEKREFYLLFYFFIGVLFLKQVGQYLRSKLFLSVQEKLEYFIHYDIFKELIYLPYRYYRTRTTGEITSKMQDLEVITTFLSELTSTFLVDIILGATSFIVLYRIESHFALIASMIGLFLMFCNLSFFKCIKTSIRKVQRKKSNVISHMVESIQGYQSIKNLAKEEDTVKKYSQLFLRWKRERKYFYTLLLKEHSIKEFLINVGSLSLIFVGILKVLKGQLTVGNLVTSQMLISYFFLPFSSFFLLQKNYQEVKSALNHIKELFYKEDSQKCLNCLNQFPLVIKNLSYSFGEIVLKDVNLQIEEFEKILLVGSSGSGKSTLLKLLLKYYKVPRRKIYWNQIDSNDIKEQTLQNQISYISQEETLFTDTLWNNLTLGRKVSEEKVLKASRICEVDRLADKDKLGYFQMLEENGFRFSGGEKQRIILARAILLERPILFLDEAMSEMDISLERRILKRILEEKITIIMVSHRLDNQDLFERVIELEEGRVIKDVSKYK